MALVFYEKNLPNGSEPNNGALSGSETLTIETTETISRLSATVFGETVDIPLSGGSSALEVVDEGKLIGRFTFTYDNGQLEYGFDLLGNMLHEPVQGANIGKIECNLNIDLSNGETRAEQIGVDVIDDVPSGIKDRIVSASEIQLNSSVGNVLGGINVTSGADGAAIVWKNGESGADGDVIKYVINGEYGALTAYSDGSYEYVVNNESVKGLIAGEHVDDLFRYAYVDADGDTEERTLTVRIDGVNSRYKVISIDSLEINDKFLPNGTSPDPAKCTSSGKMVFDAPDDLKALQVNRGHNFYDGDPAIGGEKLNVELDYGILTVWRSSESEIEYTFTQTKPRLHINDVDFYDVSICVTTRSGYTEHTNLSIKMLDDQPVYKGDKTYTLSETDENPSVFGKATDYFIKGADSGASADFKDKFTWMKETSIYREAANYGDLVLGEDGQYSFVLDKNSPYVLALLVGEKKVLDLEYFYSDADINGITGHIYIEIVGIDNGISIAPAVSNIPLINPDDPGNPVSPDNPYIPGHPGDPDRPGNYVTEENPDDPYNSLNPNWGFDNDGNAFARVFEAGLRQGTEYRNLNNRAHGQIEIYAPDGTQSLELEFDGVKYDLLKDDVEIQMNGSVLSAYLSDSLYGKHIYYEFRLLENIDHEDAQGINTFNQTVGLHAVSTKGDAVNGNIVLQIVDDVPELSSEVIVIDVPYEDAGQDEIYVGRLFPNLNMGADTKGGSFYLESNGQGEYGLLEIDANRTDMWYMPDADKLAGFGADETRTENFSYTYTDADGDSVKGTIQLNVAGIGSADKPSDNSLIFYEKNLWNGSEPNQFPLVGNSSVSLDIASGIKSGQIVHNGQSYDLFMDGYRNITTEHGVFTAWKSADNTLSYSFILASPVWDDTRLDFEAVLQDADGAIHAGNMIHVDIINDDATPGLVPHDPGAAVALAGIDANPVDWQPIA